MFLDRAPLGTTIHAMAKSKKTLSGPEIFATWEALREEAPEALCFLEDAAIRRMLEDRNGHGPNPEVKQLSFNCAPDQIDQIVEALQRVESKSLRGNIFGNITIRDLIQRWKKLRD